MNQDRNVPANRRSMIGQRPIRRTLASETCRFCSPLAVAAGRAQNSTGFAAISSFSTTPGGLLASISFILIHLSISFKFSSHVPQPDLEPLYIFDLPHHRIRSFSSRLDFAFRPRSALANPFLSCYLCTFACNHVITFDSVLQRQILKLNRRRYSAGRDRDRDRGHRRTIFRDAEFTALCSCLRRARRPCQARAAQGA